MSVYTSYNLRELMMAKKAVNASITRVKNDKRALNRGNQITRLTKSLREIDMAAAAKGFSI